ncbi:hypothetical protein PanWU01x14_160530 [Parasponia andersonii]|uniref:Uncharacterized protein n=1 Tax=Parasponia andersonii TaxID=3476 RepID=A0A2P5CE93_PARAD|nr:hypothetical protein PanWU01x14_160530 [Parasponia andersonii]
MAIQADKLKQYVKTGRSQSKEDAAKTEKGKQTQASGSREQALRIVSMIIGRPKPTQGQEEKKKYQKITEERISSLGIVTLKICATERCLYVDFVVIDCQSSFNVIMGRGWIHTMHWVASILHQVLRCLSKDGTYTVDIKRDQASVRKYFSTALRGVDASVSTSTGTDSNQTTTCQYT